MLFCSSLKSVRAKASRNRLMAWIGCRRSWLAAARNRVLAIFALSACCFATINSTSACLRREISVWATMYANTFPSASFSALTSPMTCRNWPSGRTKRYSQMKSLPSLSVRSQALSIFKRSSGWMKSLQQLRSETSRLRPVSAMWRSLT